LKTPISPKALDLSFLVAGLVAYKSDQKTKVNKKLEKRNVITKSRKMGIVAAAALLFLLTLMAPTAIQAHAATSTTATRVTGDSTASNEVATVVGSSGNLVFEEITSQLTFTGGMVGIGNASAFAVVNTVTGHVSFTEQAIFFGTIMGSKSGSVIIVISGSGSVISGTHAHDYLVDGTAGLAGIHGGGHQATAAGSSTTGFTLWVQLNTK